jgi:outer membrane receptor protein involved in Fe transport
VHSIFEYGFHMFHTVLLAAMVMVAAAPAQAGQGAAPVTGFVIDAAGAPVAAEVHEGSPTGPVVATTDARGAFSIDAASVSTGLVVVAPGFAPATINAGSNGAGNGRRPVLRVVLEPASIAEQVTVTAGRRELRGADAPGAASMLTAADLLSAAALEPDDALRQETPGFTLFRRSSSRTSNPTTQGVTMRGLSASGASRTLVLAGGVPLNDPFGGWVYWGRVPQAAIERIEVVRGGLSDLYGADAVGGVIHIVPFDATRTSARASVEAGQLDTNRLSMFAGTAFGPGSGAGRGLGGGSGVGSAAGAGSGKPMWRLNAAVERLSTEGAPIVAEDARGPIDTPAGVTHSTMFASLGMHPTNGPSVVVRGQLFGEDRENGTPLQTNDTNQRQIAARGQGDAWQGSWQASVYRSSQGYDQSFSAVGAGRASESLTSRQRVPADTVGGSAEWFRTFSRMVVLGGAETRHVQGVTTETRFVNGVAQNPTSAGGEQQTVAGFTQVTIDAAPRLSIVGGLRVDHWENKGEFSGNSQSLTPVSPRVAASFRAADDLTVRGTVYRAFRTPTLNELYRNFRAGDALTQANENLEAEMLTGTEASVLWTPGANTVRGTLFFSNLDDAIANVTLTVTPTLTTRQRQNAGSVNARGFELEVERRLTPQLAVSGMLTMTRSRFGGGGKLPELEGLDVPQVPRYSGGVSMRYVDPKWVTATLQVRAIGSQFEDDRNTLEIGKTGIVDFFASRQLARSVHVFTAIENLFDAEVPVGRLPVPTVGLPRAARFGVRVFWP